MLVLYISLLSVFFNIIENYFNVWNLYNRKECENIFLRIKVNVKDMKQNVR